MLSAMREERRLGPYRIHEELGAGAMGVVHRAVHGELGREVALKLLLPGRLDEPQLRQRFAREIRIMLQARHRALALVLDGGRLEETDFLAMELIRGVTLEDLLPDGRPLPWPVAVALASRVAEAIGYLHAQGILHRDLKASNAMLADSGDLKILDFGLAQKLDGTAITQAGTVVGTIANLAPEILSGQPATPASDLWAIGCLLYRMLAGRRAFDRVGPDLLVQILSAQPVPPSALVPGIPMAVDAVVLELLVKDPIQRLSPVTQLEARLARELGARGLSAETLLVPGLAQQLARGTWAAPPGSSAGTARPEVAPAPAEGEPTVRLGRPPEPTRALAARHVAAAVGLALLVAGAVRMSGRERTAPDAPPARTALVEPPPQAAGRVTRFWTSLAPQLAVLRDPTRAKRVIPPVRDGGLDFGADPGMWLNAVELFRWLARPPPRGRPPRPPTAGPGLMDYPDLKLLRGALRDAGTPASARALAAVVRAIGEHPEDGGSWLALGALLEDEQEPGLARAAFEHGLDHLNDALVVDGWGTVQWRGLARALRVVPGQDLERTYFAWAARCPGERPYAGLTLALRAHDAADAERLLRRAGEHPTMREPALARAGAAHDKRGEPEQARAAWERALALFPGSTTVSPQLVTHHLTRGDVEAARRLIDHVDADSLARAMFDYLSVAPAGPPRAARAEEGWLHQALIFHFIETGNVDRAEAELASPHLAGRDHALELELHAEGSASASIAAACRRRLVETTPRWADWERAAGAYAAARAQPAMARWLEEAERRYPGRWELALARALWIARGERPAAAVAALAEARRRAGAEALPADAVLEVLARAGVTRADAGPGPGAGAASAITAAWTALVAEDHDRLDELARQQLDITPCHPSWSFFVERRSRGRPDERLRTARLRGALRAGGQRLWLLRAAADR
jgi:tetratricopeptide (TPR) repeat protein